VKIQVGHVNICWYYKIYIVIYKESAHKRYGFEMNIIYNEYCNQRICANWLLW
jgi:hypothetical protein